MDWPGPDGLKLEKGWRMRSTMEELHRVLGRGLLGLGVLAVAVAASPEAYRFERVVPPLQQPWYFLEPLGVAVDIYGAVYVADTQHHRVQKFTSDGHVIARWGRLGSGDGQFTGPTAIAVDTAGNVFVADSYDQETGDPGSGNHRVQRFAMEGTFLSPASCGGRTGVHFWPPSPVTAM